MANFYNHPRTRKRNYHYPRLVTSDIKRYMSVPYGSKHYLSWSTSGQLVLEFEAITTAYGLDLTGTEGFQQLIPTAWTKLRSGSRQWWLCPECGCRCGVLYFSNGFACRHCVKPAYDCQNGSRGDYLARKIRELRHKVWGRQFNTDDVLDLVCGLPKPDHFSDSEYRAICERIQKLQGKLLSTIE